MKQKYESLVANVGNMPFGENMMLAIMFSEQNKNISGGAPIEVTMSDYYDGTVEERKVWNETYMNLHLTRKLITGCAIEDVAKDLDKGVRLGNTFYPDEVEDATGLILQYEKEKQREQRSNRYNNRNYNNNNNNNDDDKKNDDDIKKNDDDIVPGETIGVVEQ